MFIIWGEKRATRKMGFAAEHCPSCQVTRSIQIKRVGLAPHFFWIAIGKGRLLGYYGVCETCQSELDVGPTDYAALEKKPPNTLAELELATNPKLNPANREAANSFERFRSVRDPLLQAEHSLQLRGVKGMRIDWTSGLTFLAAIAIPLLILSLDTTNFSYETQESISSFAIWILIIGIIAGVVLLYREPTRYFRRELEPAILDSYRTVNPRRDELDACLKLIKKYDYQVAGFATTNRLISRLEAGQLSFQ